MDFTHLKDTNFPNLNTENVYAFQNTFDYTRWISNTKIRLVNVLWNSDYADVAKFDTNEERDNWFDSIDDYYDISLVSNTRILPDGTVKVPIPFDVAARYNYMYIDFKYATSDNNMIQYENNDGVLRWYFFVNDIQYAAPNTTIMHISIDTWTNYINDVEINYMILERGHAPVAYSDVDEYLADPINNNKYLLASDVDFGHADVCNSSDFIPVGNGDKYLCFASTCSPDEIDSLGVVTSNSDYTVGNITYSDTSARYGYQLEVHGFGLGNGYDYSNCKTPAGNFASNNGMIPNGLNVYAISMTNIVNNRFIEALLDKQPSFMYTLQGCFMVDSDMVIFGQSHHIAGFEVYEVIGNDSLLYEYAFDKSEFGYGEKYERFAKLYTFPYAYLELTDNNGKSVEVKIEETSAIRAYNAVSLAFPYINNRIYFDGIDGVGSDVYSWKSISAITSQKEMYNSDWFKYCFDMDIPCYALYMDGETAYNLTNFNRSIKNARRSALVNYHNSARQANTARANAIDLANTAYNNVDADAATIIANTANNVACNTANTEASVATNTANRLATNEKTSLETVLINACTTATAGYANSACTQTNDINVYKSSVMGITNGLGQMASSALTMGAAGFGLGGPAGAAAGALVGVATGALQIASASVAIQSMPETVAVQQSLNLNNASNTNYENSVSASNTQNLNTTLTNNGNNCMETHTRNSNARDAQNTANNAATMRANGNRTRNTTSANAGYTREVAILNAKEILENTRNGAMAAIYDSRNARPVELVSANGNMAPDYYGTRGIQMKLRTMNESELNQTGDFFARYGYALNQNWDIESSGFKLMKNFTYWKCSDVWIDDRKSSNNMVQLSIINILVKGVTVWSNPDKIGKVSIYDN